MFTIYLEVRQELIPQKYHRYVNSSEHAMLLQCLSNVVQMSWAFGQHWVDVVLMLHAHWDQSCVIQLKYGVLFSQNNPNDLQASYKSVLDLRVYFGREKHIL